MNSEIKPGDLCLTLPIPGFPELVSEFNQRVRVIEIKSGCHLGTHPTDDCKILKDVVGAVIEFLDIPKDPDLGPYWPVCYLLKLPDDDMRDRFERESDLVVPIVETT